MSDQHAYDLHALAAAAIEKAGATVIARELGISRSAPGKWAKVPAERVKRVSEITGIPPHSLRPDIYDAPQASA